MSEAGGGYFYPDSEDDEYRQSATACCPRQTIPDSCSCLEGCECLCADCDCSRCTLDDDDEAMSEQQEMPSLVELDAYGMTREEYETQACGYDGDDDPSCTVCGGEIWVECDDPIQCTYAGCDGELHPDPCCQGTGLSIHQVIW